MIDAGTGERRGAASAVATEPVRLLRLPPARLFVIASLLVVSTIAWRRGVYYDGGVDVVVLGKAALTGTAFIVALTAPAPASRGWSSLRVSPLLWLGAYLALAAASGAIDGSETVASLVLVARLAMLAAILVLVVDVYAWQQAVSAIAVAMLCAGAVAVVTGLPSLVTGRLEGGVPPLSPNAIATLLSVPLIVVCWILLTGAARWHHLAAVPLLLGLVWATGSRTGLAALLLAILVLAVTVERISLPAFITAVLSVPALLVIAAWTPLLSGFIQRDDAQALTTLNSRTVAWNAAMDFADSLTDRLVGAGLALKQIPVSAMYRDEQILDSTWVSALLQVGVIGVTLLVCFVIAVFVAVCRCEQPQRPLYLALLLYLVLRSVLESGLFDASVAFIVFFSIALYARPTTSKADTS